MPEDKPIHPTELDTAETARKIEEAGIADEGAAYSEAIRRKPDAVDEAQAHPS